eukprot:TRINITY_DN20202_c0_g1_i1.p1 TRINITY_DN20202_c0_g1~~TRINITY_DN20202_c0_g1_i1.p1  ORF type:complete len:164 (+),score=58.96 TRINITY_DN20202_c0_g1_i1:35-526(+)
MAPKGRRGVLMTASSKPKLKVAEVASDDSEKDDDKKTAESQREWEELEREAKQAARLRHAAEKKEQQGHRDTLAAYDDVAGEGNADGGISKGGAASPDDVASTVAPGMKEEEDDEDEDDDEKDGDDGLRPDGVVTAGKVSKEPGERKRAGKKKNRIAKKTRKS